jgi:uncharacterized membrane protein YphA (DoxX/SURF4 family)
LEKEKLVTHPKKKNMRLLLNAIRIFVGVLFIFSGLIKANDPLGLSYKMQEFFEIWHMDFLNSYTLVFSILMIAFEIIAGFAVILGWQFRLFSWLLFLLIIFFTFLTGYAVLSGKIKECGCFGDCIKLTAEQSFTKDLVLFLLIGFLLIKRDQIQSFFSPLVSIVLLLVVTIGSFAMQFYVLEHLPLFDCLPYKKGVDIQEKMQIPAGAIPDSTVINFVYSKNGAEVEFDAEHFPEDFNDSTYSFVKRYDKVVRKGNAEPAIKDFVIMTAGGVDTTQFILNDPREMMVLFVRNTEDAGDWLESFNIIVAFSKANDRPLIAITPAYEQVLALFEKNGIAVPVYKSDLVAVKTAARSNPTVYKVQQGVILNKWGRADLEKILK